MSEIGFSSVEIAFLLAGAFIVLTASENHEGKWP
jgi:hypothetical protein